MDFLQFWCSQCFVLTGLNGNQSWLSQPAIVVVKGASHHEHIHKDACWQHTCHQCILESLKYDLWNKNKNESESTNVHNNQYDSSPPRKCKGQVYDPDLYNCVNHGNGFLNENGNDLVYVCLHSHDQLVHWNEKEGFL